LSDDQVRRARHAYYAAISYVDERIGEVLGALSATGLDDDTIVLFTADHGEMLGERGLWYKMAFFEPAARVPLIVSAPGRFAPGRVGEPVSLLDVVPTVLDLCELEGSGRSLAGALEGADVAAADVAVEYLAEGVRSPAVMLRRGGFKYVWCADDPELLFDLDADPLELVNRAADEPDLCSDLRAEVERRWDMPALAAAVLRSQEDRRLVVEALNTGRPANWSFVPPVGAEPVQGKEDLYEFQRRARLDAPPRSSAMRER
jgi:choline-sulfatase